MKSTDPSEYESSFVDNFKRFGSQVLSTEDNLLTEEDLLESLRELAKCGFTGQTYADYDRPLQLREQDEICIIHFNDVYNIESDSAGNGGISRFIAALREQAHRNPLILFSGDAFAPSTLSTQSKGRHMIPFLNMMNIHTACVGNHDFDFGIDQLEYLTGSTQFPWLLSNVFEAYFPDKPVAESRPYRVFEWQGYRIGCMGLIEKEWLETLAEISPEDVIYIDFVERANELSKLLRSKECDMIVALTHMRAPNDERLAREADDLDLILGGHDHEYYGVKQIGNCIVAKSGTDFREFTRIVIKPGEPCSCDSDLQYERDHVGPILKPETIYSGQCFMRGFAGGSTVDWQRVDVSPLNFRNNRHVDEIVQRYIQTLQKQLDKVIGEVSVPLETRFSVIRTSECNVGNWLCDLMRATTKSDIAVLNSGTIRSDRIIPPGKISLKDLFSMLPMPDELSVLSINGRQLRTVLENSVSQYPKSEGRFLQVSGLKFTFDPQAEPSSRVSDVYVDKDGGVPLSDDKTYTICTKQYLVMGKDGFDVLRECEVVLDAETCPNLQTSARNAFSLAAIANGFRKPHNISTLKKLTTFKASQTQSLLSMKRMPTKTAFSEMASGIRGGGRVLSPPDRTATIGRIAELLSSSVRSPSSTSIPFECLDECVVDSDDRYQLFCSVEGRIVKKTHAESP